MASKILLVFSLFLASLVTQAATETICAKLMAGLSPHEPTARFIRLLHVASLEKNLVHEEELAFLERSNEPVNPFADHPKDTETFVYSSSFEEILREGGIKWDEVKAASRVLRNQKKEGSERGVFESSDGNIFVEQYTWDIHSLDGKIRVTLPRGTTQSEFLKKPDGTVLVSFVDEHAIQIIDLATNKNFLDRTPFKKAPPLVLWDEKGDLKLQPNDENYRYFVSDDRKYFARNFGNLPEGGHFPYGYFPWFDSRGGFFLAYTWKDPNILIFDEQQKTRRRYRVPKNSVYSNPFFLRSLDDRPYFVILENYAGKAYLYDIEKKDPVVLSHGHTQDAGSLSAFELPDGRKIAVWQTAGDIIVLDFTGEQVEVYPEAQGIYWLPLNSKNQILGLGTQGSLFQLYGPPGGQLP